jgi:hypothetical protein
MLIAKIRIASFPSTVAPCRCWVRIPSPDVPPLKGTSRGRAPMGERAGRVCFWFFFLFFFFLIFFYFFILFFIMFIFFFWFYYVRNLPLGGEGTTNGR